MNKAILQGNLGKDPDLRTLENGKSVASFPLATSESYKNKDGEKVNITDWHNCVIWGDRASVLAKYVKKGDRLLVEGRIKTRSYEKEGVTRYVTEMVIDNFDFLTSKSGSQEDNSPPEEKDDLPF